MLDDKDVFISALEEARELDIQRIKSTKKVCRLITWLIISVTIGWCGSVAFVTAKLIVENWR